MQKGRGGCESWVNITLHVSLSAVDFCHPRLPTNRRRANGTSLTWKLLRSFQLKPTLTRQFISHCDIDFSNNHFISGRWSIPRTRPWRSLDRSSWRYTSSAASIKRPPIPCPREMKWLLEKSLSRPWRSLDRSRWRRIYPSDLWMQHDLELWLCKMQVTHCCPLIA